MAPKRGTKRAAEEAPATAPRGVSQLQETLRKHGVTKSEFSGIEEALNHPLAPGLTEECRKMLVAMAPHAVCVRADSRTKQQQASVDMITELMQDIIEAMQAEIDCANEKLSEVDASKIAFEKKEQETQSAFTEASEAFAARKKALAEAAKAVLAAKAALVEKEQEQRSGDKAHLKVVEDKDALGAVLTNEFRKLRDGDVEGDDVKALYSKLEEQALNLGLEASLVTALPPCMTKKPSERGSFDAMVVAQLEEALTSKLSSLSEAVASAVPAAEARQAAVAAAMEQLEKAKEAQQAAADDMTAADGQRQERQQEHDAATAALTAFMPDHVQAVAARDSKIDQLQTFKDWNLACFETVRDRVDAIKKQKVAVAEEELPSKEVIDVAAPTQAAEAGA